MCYTFVCIALEIQNNHWDSYCLAGAISVCLKQSELRVGVFGGGGGGGGRFRKHPPCLSE